MLRSTLGSWIPESSPCQLPYRISIGFKLYLVISDRLPVTVWYLIHDPSIYFIIFLLALHQLLKLDQIIQSHETWKIIYYKEILEKLNEIVEEIQHRTSVLCSFFAFAGLSSFAVFVLLSNCHSSLASLES